MLLTDGMQARHEDLISVFEMTSDQLALRTDCQQFVGESKLVFDTLIHICINCLSVNIVNDTL